MSERFKCLLNVASRKAITSRYLTFWRTNCQEVVRSPEDLWRVSEGRHTLIESPKTVTCPNAGQMETVAGVKRIMMGASHAVTGAAAWLLIAGSVPTTLGIVNGVDGPALSVGIVVAAGAALLPDIDHHSGTIARSLPPISTWAAKATERLSGGHRKGTHSIVGLAIAVFWGFIAATVAVPVGTSTYFLGAGVFAVLLSAFAIRALDLVEGRLMAWLVSISLALTVVVFGADNWLWFPSAVAVGYAAHLIGDLITVGGIPVFWPFVIKPPKWWRKVPLLSNVWKASGALSAPILGKAGSTREKVLVSVLVAWMVWVCVYEWFGLNILAWLAPFANA